MAGKVSICGVNTSTLPKLKSSEQEALIRKVKDGIDGAREEFVIANMRLVLSVLQKYYNNKGNFDDLFQIGCVGLIKAIDNFNISVGVKFSTYAVPMIMGEIRRYLRDTNSLRVSRSIRDTAYQVLKAREELEAKVDNEVSLEAVAEKLKIPLKEVVCALDAVSSSVSLYEPVYNSGGDAILLMDQISDDRNTDEKWTDNVALESAIEELNERERKILYLRYYEGKTQVEISQGVGISQAQVSRLEKNALRQIKYLM